MVLTKKKNLFLFKNKIKKDSTQRDISCSPVLSRSELGKRRLPSLLLDSELLGGSDHVFWSLYSELSTMTSDSSKWSHLSFFKKYFILKYIFSLSSLYLDLWHSHECRGRQYFGIYSSVDSPGLSCSCSWTTRLCTYFIFSFQAGHKILTSSSGSAALEGISGLSFGLASCSPWIQWIQCSALVPTCQSLSDFSISYPMYIPTSSLCFHFSFY